MCVTVPSTFVHMLYICMRHCDSTICEITTLYSADVCVLNVVLLNEIEIEMTHMRFYRPDFFCHFEKFQKILVKKLWRGKDWILTRVEFNRETLMIKLILFKNKSAWKKQMIYTRSLNETGKIINWIVFLYIKLYGTLPCHTHKHIASHFLSPPISAISLPDVITVNRSIWFIWLSLVVSLKVTTNEHFYCSNSLFLSLTPAATAAAAAVAILMYYVSHFAIQ